MDLPTYTNIWRIEKRLYKLYDFRLPMPLPLGQIAVFTAIAVPYVIILAVLGIPFSHTLLWLYVLPPGVLAWFATRPVLEGKKLPELIASQARYLGEPRTWARLTPLAESDEVAVTARVWRRALAIEAEGELSGEVVTAAAREVGDAGHTGARARPGSRPGRPVRPASPRRRPAWSTRAALATEREVAEGGRDRGSHRERGGDARRLARSGRTALRSGLEAGRGSRGRAAPPIRVRGRRAGPPDRFVRFSRSGRLS